MRPASLSAVHPTPPSSVLPWLFSLSFAIPRGQWVPSHRLSAIFPHAQQEEHLLSHLISFVQFYCIFHVLASGYPKRPAGSLDSVRGSGRTVSAPLVPSCLGAPAKPYQQVSPQPSGSHWILSPSCYTANPCVIKTLRLRPSSPPLG